MLYALTHILMHKLCTIKTDTNGRKSCYKLLLKCPAHLLVMVPHKIMVAGCRLRSLFRKGRTLARGVCGANTGVATIKCARHFPCIVKSELGKRP